MADFQKSVWTFWGVLKTFGIPAMLIVGASALIVNVAIFKQLDNATKRIDDLMAQVGRSEEKMRQAEDKALVYQSVIDRLQKLDNEKIDTVLKIMEQPAINNVISNEQVALMQRNLAVLAREIATVYMFADDDACKINGLYPYTLKWTWQGRNELKKQFEVGSIPDKWFEKEIVPAIQSTALSDFAADEARRKK